MTRGGQFALAGGIIVAIAAGVFAFSVGSRGDLGLVELGSTAPDFKAYALDAANTPRTLRSYKGKTVLLNVWATWCEPCKVEMPSMEKLHRLFGDKGLTVVAVSIDAPGKEKDVAAYAKKNGYTFEIVHDPDGEIQRIYQTTGVPESFVISPDGKILRKVIGAEDWVSGGNRALFAKLLGVPLPDTTAFSDSGRKPDTLRGTFQRTAPIPGTNPDGAAPAKP
ncbi:MAG: TlpA family protein disulfide reductase [Gemmatimonadetes bacterium]|nr:TlpA family protein disulfide reductase [Gemmatimonadota bacterium]